MGARRFFRSASVVDGGGAKPRLGDVLVDKGRIVQIYAASGELPPPDCEVVDCSGRTLLPGMCDAHSHLGLINVDYFSMTAITPEKHYRIAATNAARVAEAGFTMCIGAGAAKDGQDTALRDDIASGKLAGPHLLAAGAELSKTGSYVDPPPLGPFTDTPAVLASDVESIALEAARICAGGIDILKLGLSGDNGTPHAPSSSTVMSDLEVDAAVREARSRGVRINAHARSAHSVRQCLRFGIDFISHADLIEEPEIEELARRRDEFFVVPGMAYLARALEGDGEAVGLTAKAARALGFERELEQQVAAMRKLKSLGVRILTGGDYGFAWTPHGTNARDLDDFVSLLDYTPPEAIAAATSLGAAAMRRSDDLGRLAPGYQADLVLVDGDPVADIAILRDPAKIIGVMKSGTWLKAPSTAVGAAAGETR